ncbi:Ohr family peroxiredoxin [Lysobacter sp. A6]|uniref:Ohr family peroxiredoxin n=1 Tax=Noviluteimonas lactosilytica TaxID=2888523 RepID=A0ABS8JIG7_9GAMM|nr:Ohr family peroxiredoxin [Lysobacter lactosilyticus]MCC8363352.1 Ohr family peroxiredoxin [Lysobacter lactosilyticus]
MTIMRENVLFSGKTHTTPTRREGANPNNHGVDLHVAAPGAEAIVFEDAAPHPTAEQLFAGAWSACYITAIGLVAMQKKVKLPADMAVDIQVDLLQAGADYFLRARFDVALPGLDQATAEAIAHEADLICPYSKATRNNIDVVLNVHTS